MNPVTTLWHPDVDKRARDRKMSCKRLQPSHCPSANSLTLVPAQSTESIAAGDSQAAVPFPTEIRRDFDLQWKTASSLSYLLLQLGSNGREVSLPEKGATEATSCPKGGNMWRNWYGLTQAWGSTTYDWILGQILPRSREEGCQQNLTESSVKRRHGFTMRETLPWKNAHTGLPKGESGHTDT